MIVDADSCLVRLFFYDGPIFHAEGGISHYCRPVQQAFLLLSYQELTYSPVLILLQTKLVSQLSQISSFPITQPVPGSMSVFNSTISSARPWINVSNGSFVHWLHPLAHG